jgi:HTH-type transcriptional regulator, competence development regulator
MSSVTFGQRLKKARSDRRMTLRDVEAATGKLVSNSYLSQLENGKIEQPSPHILSMLAVELNVSYETIMEWAGYIIPSSNKTQSSNNAMFTIDGLTADEEAALLNYLEFFRSTQKRGIK